MKNDHAEKFGSDETGFAFILVALLLVILLSFMALFIDFTRQFSSNAQAVDATKLALLSALDEYSRIDGEHSVRAPAALARLNDLLSTTLSASSGKDTVIKEVYEIGDQGRPDGSPTVEFGKRYTAVPVVLDAGGNSTCSNPCVNGETVTQSAGCFVPIEQVKQTCTVAAAWPPLADSARVRGSLFEPQNYLFAPVFGPRSFDVPVNVTVGMYMRWLVFDVDISQSMTRLTHDPNAPPYNPLTPTAKFAKKFAFALSQDNPGNPPGTLDDALWNSLPVAEQAKYTAPITIPNTMSLDTNYHYPDGASINFPTFYYPMNSRYPGWTAYGSARWISIRNSTSANLKYRVDKTTPPQPFFSVLQGIRAAADALSQRGISGDRLGMIVSDSGDFMPGRIIKVTDNFQYIKDYLKFAGMPRNNAAEQAQYEAELEIAVKRGFLPLFQRQSDLLSGVQMSHHMLNQGLGASSTSKMLSRGIAMFSDFLANCCPITTDGQLEVSRDWVFTGTQGTRAIYGGPGCLNTFDHYLHSIGITETYALSKLIPENIAVHTAPVGYGPHILRVPSVTNPGQCMSDEEARTAAIFANRNGPQELVSPGQWGTDLGVWRDAYRNVGNPTPVNGNDYSRFLLATAKAYWLSRRSGGTFHPIMEYSSDSDACTMTCSTATATTPQFHSCEREEVQIQDAIEDLLRFSPYMVVESNERRFE